MFSLKMLYYCFSIVQPVTAWCLQFCWLATDIHAALDSLNLVINWVQLWPVEGHSWREIKLRVLCSSCWTMLHTGACVSCVAERQTILLSTTCLITANMNNPYFWHSNIGLLNDEFVVTDGSALYSLPRFCLVHTSDSCAIFSDCFHR